MDFPWIPKCILLPPSTLHFHKECWCRCIRRSYFTTFIQLLLAVGCQKSQDVSKQYRKKTNGGRKTVHPFDNSIYSRTTPSNAIDGSNSLHLALSPNYGSHKVYQAGDAHLPYDPRPFFTKTNPASYLL